MAAWRSICCNVSPFSWARSSLLVCRTCLWWFRQYLTACARSQHRKLVVIWVDWYAADIPPMYRDYYRLTPILGESNNANVQDWASVKDRKDRRIDDNLGDKSTLRIAPVFFLVLSPEIVHFWERLSGLRFQRLWGPLWCLLDKTAWQTMTKYMWLHGHFLPPLSSSLCTCWVDVLLSGQLFVPWTMAWEW